MQCLTEEYEMSESERLITIPILVGETVFLRPMEPEDNSLTYPWFLESDPQSQSCRPIKIVSVEEVVEASRKREATDKEGSLMIVRKEDRAPVGKIRYFNLNLLNRTAEIGYLINPAEQRKGYAREGLSLLARFLFEKMNLNKIYAQTGAFNSASVALLRSLNFKQDATLREHHFYNGKLHDDYIFSLLRREFEDNK